MQAAVYELKDRDGNVDKLHVLKHKHKGERLQQPCGGCTDAPMTQVRLPHGDDVEARAA